jgi:hypothetical protein
MLIFQVWYWNVYTFACLLALRAINTCRLRPDAGQIPLMRPFDRNMRKDHVKMWEEN